MTRHDAPQGPGVRDVLRRWPVVALVALVAVAAGLLALSHRVTEYTAGTRLVVVPLVQWDEAFLGTGLARDAGDAGRTAATVAGLLESPRVAREAAAALGAGATSDAVAAAVEVTVVDGTNLIEVTARGTDPAGTSALAEAFTAAAVADRWRSLAPQLDARIAELDAATGLDATAGEASGWLTQLRAVRAGGSDPTVRFDTATPVTQVDQLPSALVVAMATVGGLFLGVLVAFGIATLPSRRPRAAGGPAAPSNGVAASGDRRASLTTRES